MHPILGWVLAALGASTSVAAAVSRRRLAAIRRTGRRPDPDAERRTVKVLLAGLALLSIGLLALVLPA